MAKLYNLVRMTTATTGTGTITLGSAVSGYLTFALAGVANGDVVDYAIKDGSNSEHGTGTYTASGTTLSRTVTKSTNSNAAISLSGTAEVFISPRAETLNDASLFTTGTLNSARLPASTGFVAYNVYSATQTITIPAGATRALVKMVAPGGGSGGSSTTSTPSAGGGSGSYLEKYLTGLTPGNTLALTVGAVGTAGASTPGAGGTGGNSSLASGTQTISTLTVNGGAGSVVGTTGNTAGGAGGAISTGGRS
jgi:hypothetical protein